MKTKSNPAIPSADLSDNTSARYRVDAGDKVRLISEE